MVENFKYESLKLKTLPSMPEGSFAYERSSLKAPDPGTLLLPMLITWGTFYWGDGTTYGEVAFVKEVGADFTYSRLKMADLNSEHIRTKAVNPEE